MDGRMINKLSDSINRIDEKGNGIFGLRKAVLCALHLENFVNEKLVIMALIEGLKRRTNGVQSQA